jgi:hypothetical protein
LEGRKKSLEKKSRDTCRCGPDAVAGVEWAESEGGPNVLRLTYVE